ncbi:MAG TPA: hypothetical protein VE959_08390 [Bryobacteraceae bacterium]|nr:hypothetical protein [Bryobacteraceae bacterium]
MLLWRPGRHAEARDAESRGLALKPTFAVGHQIPLFKLHHSPDLTPRALAEEHRQWGLRYAAALWDHGRRHVNSPEPGRRLRVGYVSADFYAHPVSYFTAPVFSAHDREQVEIVCYGLDRNDSWTLRIRRQAGLWRNMTGLGDAELAEMIERDRIDILVDLAGYTAGNRLLAFARKPAPVQVSWLGYFNTTGMEAMDYLLVDPQLAPPEEEAPFVEKPLRLPGCYLAYEIPAHAPTPAPAPCGYRGFVTYGSFNNMSKVGLEVISVWAEILRRNPTAHIALMNAGLGDGPSRDLYRRHFEDCGITPDRLHLSDRVDRLDVFGAYAHLDLALDPFPYNGGTTTCEALAMGVPVVTLAGDRFVSRVGSTILHNAGLPELIAHSREEYIQKAVELGRNPARLAGLRSSMRARLAQSTLCDIAGFTRKLENAYREIWREWCSRQLGG